VILSIAVIVLLLVCKVKNKSKSVDLRTLWDRAAKTRKVELGSTSVPQPVTEGSNAQPQDPIVESAVPITDESQVHNQTNPSVEHDTTTREVTVPEIASTDQMSPEIGSNELEINIATTEPSTLSPIRDGDDSGYESSGDAIYDIDLLPHDPGKRLPINRYNVNERNSVVRGYIAKGPCQPWSHDFPIRYIGGKPRRFLPDWFGEFTWLEYSVEKDAAFCFVCYLFKHKTNSSGGDAFVSGGFRNWHMKKRITKHCGSKTSFHKMALERYISFITPKKAIDDKFSRINDKDKTEYMARLSYSIQAAKYLLRQGLASRGHDESESSLNKGNFLELIDMLAENFEEVAKVVLKNAPKNCQLTAPQIQREIANCCAKETTKLLMEDLGGEYFAILADESSDVYQNEQLALCLRYVNKKGSVVERFLGVVHVENTTALTLKTAIENLLMEHSLSLSMVHGQGYDGASNMKGYANGLKKLIMDNCPSTYYVNCFAHQLQLTIMSVAKENLDYVWFVDPS